MLYLGLKKRYIFAALTATVKAGEFLQPWTYGSRKDYSDNVNYAVGVKIITEWEADFSNATVTLNQDNNPGDAQGGPSVGLEGKFFVLSISSDLEALRCLSQWWVSVLQPDDVELDGVLRRHGPDLQQRLLLLRLTSRRFRQLQWALFQY